MTVLRAHVPARVLAAVGVVLVAVAIVLVATRDDAAPAPPEPPVAADASPDDRPDRVPDAPVDPERRTETETGDGTLADPAAPRRDPTFDDRTARLSGRVTRGDVGVVAELELVAGMNLGVVLASEPDGTFSSDRLYPGRARVVVRELGRPMCERDVVLADGNPTSFTVDLSPGPRLEGTVVDGSGERIAGAVVRCDFVEAVTGPDGAFVLPRNASGLSSVHVRAEGFASTALPTWGGSWQRIVMRRGGGLRIAVDSLRHGGEAVVYLLPTEPSPRLHPWDRLSPVRVRVGAECLIEDLPRQTVEVRAFHPFAVGRTATASVRAGTIATARVEWEPLPIVRGVVVHSGRPVPGAEVALEVPDLAEALVVALRTASAYVRAIPFEPVPASVQRVVTDGQGRFAFGRPELLRTRASIVVRDAAGRSTRVPLPAPDDTAPVVVDLGT